MNILKIGHVQIQFPATPGELPRGAWKVITPVVAQDKTPFTQAMALRHLVGERQWKKLKSLDPVQLLEVSREGTDWLWDIPNDLDGEVYPLLSYVYLTPRYYFFPQRTLEDVTVEEYAAIQAIREEMEQEPHRLQELTIHLAAVILRKRRSPRDPLRDKQPRRNFSPELAVKQRSTMQRLPPHAQWAVVDYVVRCDGWLRQAYEAMFTPDPNYEGPRLPDDKWPGMIQAVAETGVFGTYNEVLAMNIHDFCYFSARKAQQSKAQSQYFKEQRRKQEQQTRRKR